MFALLRSRWIALTVVLPLVVWCLDRVGSTIETKRGASSVTRALRKPHEMRQRRRAKSERDIVVA